MKRIAWMVTRQARLALAAAALGAVGAGAAPAAAQDGAPAREVSLMVYGDDPCPPSTNEDIVVCARRPEEERYRIPPRLRRGARPTEVSWSSRIADLDEAARDLRPNSCSVVGSFGQTGCTQQMIRNWYDDRRARPAGR